MKYFNISHGLRGCYMPDDSFVIACTTRRELKECIANEATLLDSDSTIGLTKRNIASLAALAWREARKRTPAFLPYCLPCKERGQSSYSYGIFVSVATRHDYLAQSND